MSGGNFEQFKFNRQLLNAIADLGYDVPTTIQRKAIPLILDGHDLLGIAQTGTGKTAAFVLPLLMKVKYAQGIEPRALILAPTKELVVQIEQNCREMAKYTDLRFAVLFGGVGPKTQIATIQQGVDIMVATPGRFMDIYLRGEIITRQIKTLVLDEADKMMDMGFMPQVRKILEVIPVKRQNLLFSATMPLKVMSLSEEFLDFPEVVEVSPQATTVDTIEQVYYKVPNIKSKINFLAALLDQEDYKRVIIFTRTKQIADNVYKFIERKNLGPARVLHSNKGQNARMNAMSEFKEGDLKVLVTTDVSARGIDVSAVSHVINFDVPQVYEDYVHRIGRTGRAQQQGIAVTFVNKAEEYHIEKIEQLIRQPIPEKPLPPNIKIVPTEFVEQQEIAKAIDHQKRLENSDFKGAFHEKKQKHEFKGSKFKGGSKKYRKKRR
jgi:ATP-dependent RNA helicase RhlE